MSIFRLSILMAILSVLPLRADGRSHSAVVVDSLTNVPIANASIFSRQGILKGITTSAGHISGVSPSDYPITIRCMGFHEQAVNSADRDTVFMIENIMELPEFIVESKQKRMLHLLAYVREYSTLSSYTDTITMFREKMVDFMLPGDKKVRYKGWRTPRVLNSKSYYRFTDYGGLDSVSDRCHQHFSWSDWVGITPSVTLPMALTREEMVTDTVCGNYGLTELWSKNGERVSIDVDVLADTASRKWVPNLSTFFRKDNIEFEQFRIRLNFANIMDKEAAPSDLTGYSFNIESRGRGHDMFMFNRYDKPFFVTTYTEVYILDKEYITVKEAKKWDKRRFDTSVVEILEPIEAPALQPSVLALIDRVNNIDNDKVRLGLEPDHRLIGRNVSKQNFSIGNRALSILKQLTGISSIKFHKNFNDNWRTFRNEQKEYNAGKEP